MDTKLENNIQYPILARSPHTNSGEFGEMVVLYLKNNLNISNFDLLVPQDSYGYGITFQQVSTSIVVDYGRY